MSAEFRRMEARMAGEAPEYYSNEGRVRRWLFEGSDAAVAVVLLLLAIAIVASVVVIDWSFF